MVKCGHFSIFFIISFCLLYLNVSNAQTVMTFKPSKDNTLFFSTDGNASNGAGPHFFAGTIRTGNIRRGILAFDVSAIPQGALVTEVTLTMKVSNAQGGAQDIGLYRVTADWGEAGSMATGPGLGQPAPAQTGDATWLHRFFNSASWTFPGGDFSFTMSASQSVTGTGSYTWGSTSEMIADVQLWVDDPDTNFGWIVMGNEGANQTAKRFDSKEHPTEGSRPLLTVTYTPTSVENSEGLLEQFTLAQNYPNPFNPSTVINYTIPQSLNSSQVKLEIFNLLGQKVITFVDARQVAGEHSIQWDGTNEAGNLVTSGVYLYRLKAESFVEMRKMMFIR